MHWIFLYLLVTKWVVLIVATASAQENTCIHGNNELFQTINYARLYTLGSHRYIFWNCNLISSASLLTANWPFTYFRISAAFERVFPGQLTIQGGHKLSNIRRASPQIGQNHWFGWKEYQCALSGKRYYLPFSQPIRLSWSRTLYGLTQLPSGVKDLFLWIAGRNWRK